MLAIALVVAASTAAAEPQESRLVVGPFTIISTVRKIDGFPYPAIVKKTGLHWTSADQLVMYDLEDSGEDVYVRMAFKNENSTNNCSATSSPMRLQSEPISFFDTKAVMRWACITGSPDSRGVAKTPELASAPYAAEIEEARSEFPKAYAAFLDQTHKLHGPSTERCLKFDFGNHGSVCVQRSDD